MKWLARMLRYTPLALVAPRFEMREGLRIESKDEIEARAYDAALAKLDAIAKEG
jgi:hypothetical protein